jgi:all-trans-retinol 13,14-reductase
MLMKRKRAQHSYSSYDQIPGTVLTHIPTRQTLQTLDHSVDIILIGSGIGALTTANILSRFGYKVVVFEQHYTAGGSTHVYKAEGFDFDVGVHYVGGQLDRWNSVFRILFDWLSDGKLKWSSIDKVYDVAYNNRTGERLQFVGNRKENRDTLLRHFKSLKPSSLDLYYQKCRKARSVAYIAFALKTLPPLATKLCWKLGFGKVYERYCLGTTWDVMKSCGLPDEVIGVLTYSWGDYGTPPSKSPFFAHAFMENHYDGGAFFPKGGSSSIGKTLVAALRRRGGEVFSCSPVDRMLTEMSKYGGYKATGVIVKGIKIHAKKCVVSDAGFAKTFEISGESVPLVESIAGAHQLALVHHKEVTPPLFPSLAFYDLFIGLNGTDKELGLLGQNIWHLADWNHDVNMRNLFSAGSMNDASSLQPPLVFLSNESAKDPTYSNRHPGKATVTMITWTNSEWFDQYKNTSHGKRGKSYDNMKKVLTDKLLEILYFHFPKTKGRVIFTDLGTPLSANKYLGRISGEIYNLDLTETRFKTVSSHLALHPQTTVQNLYLTGQDVVAVSIEGATLSGCFAAARVSTIVFWFMIPMTLALVPWVVW